jgi:hypothetical protein
MARENYYTLFELDDRIQHLAAWAREYNLTSNTLKHRLSSGMPLREALTRPVKVVRHLSSEARVEAQRTSAKRRVERTRLAVRQYKEARACADCKKTYPAHVMDFDHVRGKKLFDISKMPDYPRRKIAEEIAKCDLVCANCHRIRTFSRRA